MVLIVDAFLDHHVDLDGRKARVVRRVDALQHIGYGKIDVVHGAEDRFIERIERDGHALEAGGLERLCFPGQQRGIGGEGQIQGLAVRRLEGGQHPDQTLKVFAQQWLAAGETDFHDATGDEQACQAADFLEAQQFSFRQEFVCRAEDRLGHAVGAAEVAAVGDRNTQVAQEPAARVCQRAAGDGRGHRNDRHAAGGALVNERNYFGGHGRVSCCVA